MAGAITDLGRTTGAHLTLELMADSRDVPLEDYAIAKWDGLPPDPMGVLLVGTTRGPHAQVIQGTALDALVSQAELDGAVLGGLHEPVMRGDWCEGVLAFTASYRDAMAPVQSPSAEASPMAGDTGPRIPDA
ncbi:MAG: hypothetical protein U0667_08340 [Chloroflexota bacterium]